jgi:hypothetical protein
MCLQFQIAACFVKPNSSHDLHVAELRPSFVTFVMQPRAPSTAQRASWASIARIFL